MRCVKPLLIGLALAGFPITLPVKTQDSQPGFACACQAVGPDAAAAAVRRATGGRVLGVQSGGQGDRPVYEVKVLLEGGRVRVLRVDGCTGQVLG